LPKSSVCPFEGGRVRKGKKAGRNGLRKGEGKPKLRAQVRREQGVSILKVG